jgi:threonine synthase
MGGVVRLECSACRRAYDPVLRGVCACGKPLLARYDLTRTTWEDLRPRPDLWRYLPLLPVAEEDLVTLGEGGTPLLSCPRLAADLGLREVYVKDEGRNPTGTFKARGMAVAVAAAKAFGLGRLIVPTAGNAGSALAAYAARAGMEAVVLFADGTPETCVEEARAHGAAVARVHGAIDAAGRLAAADTLDAFSVATLREPYRIEGKKTMGFEVWEQLGGLPDWIVVPTGGGTGIVGLWKAFGELEALRWHRGPKARLAFVQAEGCAPLVAAFEEGAEDAVPWPTPTTMANGLRVPSPLGGFLVLRAARETGGLGVAVADEEMARAARDLARREGISACYEGAATLAALRRLLAEERIARDESVVLLNTGAATRSPERRPGADVPYVEGVDDLAALLDRARGQATEGGS